MAIHGKCKKKPLFSNSLFKHQLHDQPYTINRYMATPIISMHQSKHIQTENKET
jgi:hypothetical protein